MRFMKNAALLFVLALSLMISTGAAIGDATPPTQQSDSSVSFLFGESWGRVTVSAAPTSIYQVSAVDPLGLPVLLAMGAVGPNGIGNSMFVRAPGLSIATITVTLTSPGLPPVVFAYDSELDRWIID